MTSNLTTVLAPGEVLPKPTLHRGELLTSGRTFHCHGVEVPGVHELQLRYPKEKWGVGEEPIFNLSVSAGQTKCGDCGWNLEDVLSYPSNLTGLIHCQWFGSESCKLETILTNFDGDKVGRFWRETPIIDIKWPYLIAIYEDVLYFYCSQIKIHYCSTNLSILVELALIMNANISLLL